MCGVVKPVRVECGPKHCGLPGQAIGEAHQHSAVCQVGGRVGAGDRPRAPHCRSGEGATIISRKIIQTALCRKSQCG